MSEEIQLKITLQFATVITMNREQKKNVKRTEKIRNAYKCRKEERIL